MVAHNMVRGPFQNREDIAVEVVNSVSGPTQFTSEFLNVSDEKCYCRA